VHWRRGPRRRRRSGRASRPGVRAAPPRQSQPATASGARPARPPALHQHRGRLRVGPGSGAGRRRPGKRRQRGRSCRRDVTGPSKDVTNPAWGSQNPSGPPFLLQKHVPGRVPSLHGSYSASTLLRTPQTPDRSRAKGYVFPFAVASADALCRVSQVPIRSFDTRRPLSPRKARPVHMPVASWSVTGFSTFGRLATFD
jgi:hypothetical protein